MHACSVSTRACSRRLSCALAYCYGQLHLCSYACKALLVSKSTRLPDSGNNLPVVPDAASRADPPPAVPPVLDVNNVARFKRATAADNVNIPTIASDPLARFKRQRKSESSSISSSPSAPATSSSSSSSYSIGGLNYLPPNAPNFFNTILPTLHNETLTPGGPVSSWEITAAEKAALPLHIRYNAPIKRRLAARKTARTYTYTKRKRGIPRELERSDPAHESACLV
eukprot:g47880.t1